MNTADLLRRCVGNDMPAQKRMSSIMAAGDYLYATNGAILLRLPREEGIAAVEHVGGIPAKADALIDAAKLCKWTAIGALPTLPLTPPCVDCNGSGRAMVCLDCEGEGCIKCFGVGQFTLPPDHTGDTKPCFWCEGTGHLQTAVEVIPGAHYDARLLALIADLPDLRFHAQATDNRAPTAAYFSFAHRGARGEGLLMPMRA